MIIQFNPSALGLASSSDTPSQSLDSPNWLHDESHYSAGSQGASLPENVSNIVNLELIYPEEPTLFPNYVEEVKAKPFKGANSVALSVREELLAATHAQRADRGAAPCPDRQFLDTFSSATAMEFLPNAA